MGTYEVSTDYRGEALDYHVKPGVVVSMRRHGKVVAFCTVGGVANLTAEEAREVGISLLAAAELAEQEVE
jgi:hypothetical protein